MYSFTTFKYFTSSALKTLTMKYAKTKELLRAFAIILQFLLTVSYLGAYRYCTLEPIKIMQNGNSKDELMKESIDFRQIKNEELSFMTKAVSQQFFAWFVNISIRRKNFLPSSYVLYKATLSAAAVIGVFSWPIANTAVWVAKMLWNWSFFISTFSLIGFAHIRLLEHLPDKNKVDFDEKKISMILSLFLQSSAKQNNFNVTTKHRRMSKKCFGFGKIRSCS